MLSKLLKVGSNSKLGKSIASWNIPAVMTCPGRTKECESVCYANKGLFKMQRKLHLVNKDHADADDFVNNIKLELINKKISAVRIHAAGDFYDEAYLDKWIEIAKQNPETKFWAYTRSWRVAGMMAKLKQFGNFDNVQLFASIDGETKTNKETPPVWMRVADIVPSFDERVDYVKCPNQKNKAITCEKCTYCFKPVKGKKMHVQFQIH
jgi:hypothetical protein